MMHSHVHNHDPQSARQITMYEVYDGLQKTWVYVLSFRE